VSSAPGAADLLGGWQLNGAFVSIAAVGLLYAAGVRRAPRWRAWRTASFACGMALLALAMCSGIERYANSLLSVHMAQHLLLSLAAAPLLVLGAPVRLGLAALPRAGGRALARAGAGRPGLLLHPLAAGALFATAGLLLHVPAVYEASLRQPWLHAAVHSAFLASALLFWTPLLAPAPLAHRLSPAGKLAYVVLAMPAMAAVGVVLATGSGVAYEPYVAAGRALGVSALSDQRLAGALMWIGGAAVLGAAFFACGWQALVAEERRALAREARTGGGG
jgi:putative membrane protein